MFWTISFFVIPAPVHARAITSVHTSMSFRVYPTTTGFPVVPDFRLGGERQPPDVVQGLDLFRLHPRLFEPLPVCGILPVDVSDRFLQPSELDPAHVIAVDRLFLAPRPSPG